MHSVLFLILAFFNAAGLFVLLGAEFLAMILVIVYVGAVAVLFLFVVMMLDVDFAELREGFLRYLPWAALVGVVLLVELVLVSAPGRSAPRCAAGARGADPRRRRHQHRGDRPGALHRLRLLLPGRRPGAAGGDDRRDRADAAPPAGRAPPEHRRPGRAHAGDAAMRRSVQECTEPATGICMP